jgi:hypothetical protein
MEEVFKVILIMHFQRYVNMLRHEIFYKGLKYFSIKFA